MPMNKREKLLAGVSFVALGVAVFSMWAIAHERDASSRREEGLRARLASAQVADQTPPSLAIASTNFNEMFELQDTEISKLRAEKEAAERRAVEAERRAAEAARSAAQKRTQATRPQQSTGPSWASAKLAMDMTEEEIWGPGGRPAPAPAPQTPAVTPAPAVTSAVTPSPVVAPAPALPAPTVVASAAPVAARPATVQPTARPAANAVASAHSSTQTVNLRAFLDEQYNQQLASLVAQGRMDAANVLTRNYSALLTEMTRGDMQMPELKARLSCERVITQIEYEHRNQAWANASEQRARNEEAYQVGLGRTAEIRGRVDGYGATAHSVANAADGVTRAADSLGRAVNATEQLFGHHR